MYQFKIQPKKDGNGNDFLTRETQAYFNSYYSSGAGQWRVQGSIENIICTLKHDITPYANDVLDSVSNQLYEILLIDLPHIYRLQQKEILTVCAIPRAKINYNANQLLFIATVGRIAQALEGFIDGTSFIKRTIDTRTTHRNRWGHGGNGDLPYPKITINTCQISNQIFGKDILLIDDLYTNSVNIDEDAIQALYDKGANSVIFYSVGAKLGL